MSDKQWVYEVLLDDFDSWFGNQLYDTMEYAKFCAEQDLRETVLGYGDHEFTWEFITKNLYHMYMNGDPNGVSIRVRHVNSLGN